MSADLQRLSELIDRLNETCPQGRELAAEKQRDFNAATWERVKTSGSSFNEASGWLSFLGETQQEAQDFHRRAANDLGEQIRAFNHILDYWFSHGEPVAPGYPSRIALLLRKMKRLDLERFFLEAYARHFLSHYYGASSRDLNARIRKVLSLEDNGRQ